MPLNRSQSGLVRDVQSAYEPTARKFDLHVTATEDCQLEMWWLEDRKKLFEETFGFSANIELAIG